MQNKAKLKPLLSAMLLASVSIGYSQLTIAGAVQTPDAGIILQQTEPALPAEPASNETGLEEKAPTDAVDSKPFDVSSISISGNTLFDSTVLHALVKDAEGTSQTLLQVKALADRITDYYRNEGYPLSRAVIPQQSIENGLVQIQVIEARLGDVSIDNSSRVNDGLIESTAKQLTAGEAIAQESLERTLLLLNDLPGTNISANLSAGKEAGSTDLNVSATPAPMIAGRVTLDGYGNRFINRERIGASVSVFNPIGLGDVLSLSVITTGKRMQYGLIDYNLALNGYGTRLGASYGALHYALGDEISALRAHGQAQTGDLWVRHPFVRSAKANLYGTVKYNYADLEDRVDAAFIKNDRHVKTWSGILNGDFRDGAFGGGINSMSIQFTNGQVKFDDPIAEIADSVTANTDGSFSKWNINLNRLQAINAKTSLWLSISGQIAEDNLDSSQKMVFGGPFSVRAYDTGAISGDNGVIGTVELRRSLGNFHGLIQGVAFADVGQVRVNDKPWATATGDNRASLSGVGLGVNWFGNKQWAAKASLATSTGSRADLTKDADNSIAWLEVSKGF